MTGRKYEPPLYLDMDFEEALERFGTTDPKEVRELMETGKTKKPPGPDNAPTARPRQTATPSGRSKRRKADE
jgi:hypothetical protein